MDKARSLKTYKFADPDRATASLSDVAAIGVYCWRHQEIVWRGTLYPSQQLRSGQRVKI